MVRALAQVFPFRVNEYVISELIDWRSVPEDPIFQLVFPQRGMLSDEIERRLLNLTAHHRYNADLKKLVADIRSELNPHPSGQRELNVPKLDGTRLQGIQHKYQETVLYFPRHGQTCHSYCTYCFRWAQFIGESDLRFAADDPSELLAYLIRHPAVSDVLVTGGDPMTMSAVRLRTHLEPLLGINTVKTIRIGTKSAAYWPNRFTDDRDADDILRLFEQVVASGRTLAVMAHYSHPREIGTETARRAIERIRSTGATIYAQAPMVAHVNDDAATWQELWRTELAAGIIPYYLFVERDTGPYDYYKVPLSRSVRIFQDAYRTLPGLARTVRGPVMSTTPGKVVVDGVVGSGAERFFQLHLVQARDPDLVNRPFRARYSESACWLSDLELSTDTPPDIAAALRGSVRG